MPEPLETGIETSLFQAIVHFVRAADAHLGTEMFGRVPVTTLQWRNTWWRGLVATIEDISCTFQDFSGFSTLLNSQRCAETHDVRALLTRLALGLLEDFLHSGHVKSSWVESTEGEHMTLELRQALSKISPSFDQAPPGAFEYRLDKFHQLLRLVQVLNYWSKGWTANNAWGQVDTDEALRRAQS